MLGLKNAGHAEVIRRRQLYAQLLRLRGHKIKGNAQQNARAVAGHIIGPRRAAMVQIQQHLPAQFDHRAVRAAADIHHRADAAGIMFKSGVIKAPRLYRIKRHFLTSFVTPHP